MKGGKGLLRLSELELRVENVPGLQNIWGKYSKIKKKQQQKPQEKKRKRIT